jgi:hypothetical protein
MSPLVTIYTYKYQGILRCFDECTMKFYGHVSDIGKRLLTPHSVIEGGVFDHGHKYVLYLIGCRTVPDKTIDTSIYKVVVLQSVLLFVTLEQGWLHV